MRSAIYKLFIRYFVVKSFIDGVKAFDTNFVFEGLIPVKSNYVFGECGFSYLCILFIPVLKLFGSQSGSKFSIPRFERY